MGDFTIALGGQMDFDSFDQFDSDANIAIVNHFGDSNISTLIQNGISNMASIDQYGKAIQLKLLRSVIMRMRL